jgi:hypothetical protein
MATQLRLSAAVEAKLKEIARKIGNGSVSVGFLAGATYPDGTPVASVAFWNEFGHKGRKLGPDPSAEAIAEGERREPERAGGAPPRPFFRSMISKESPEWGDHLGQALIVNKSDGTKALALMGEEIKGELVQSINDFTTPPLAASTIRRKGFAKPLIDTGDMLRSVDFRVA